SNATSLAVAVCQEVESIASESGKHRFACQGKSKCDSPGYASSTSPARSAGEVILAEPPPQPWQHHLAVQLQEPCLVRPRRVEHEVPEPKLHIRCNLLHVLVRIGRHDPAAGGALHR